MGHYHHRSITPAWQREFLFATAIGQPHNQSQQIELWEPHRFRVVAVPACVERRDAQALRRESG